MTQQKQRKQLILTDNKNISTCRSQQIQHLQPNNYDWWHKKFHLYQPQWRQRRIKILSFISQRQRKQPNFMNNSIRTFVHTKQPNTYTQPEQPKHDINVG